MTASMRPRGVTFTSARYASTSRASGLAVPGFHVPATAAGLVGIGLSVSVNAQCQLSHAERHHADRRRSFLAWAFDIWHLAFAIGTVHPCFPAPTSNASP